MSAGKKAIFISAIEYESPIQIGDHHLARQFARDGWNIAFLSKPVTPFHFFSKDRRNFLRRARTYIAKGKNHQIGEGRIWSYVPGSFVIPKNFPRLLNRFIFENWHHSVFPSINKVLTENGFGKVDLIYIRDPMQNYILDQIPHENSIFRIADNDLELVLNREYAEIESAVARKVDCVIYSAKELESHVRKINPRKMFYLPNGVDCDHFQNGNRALPAVYENSIHPIIVYVGSIDYWFDFGLISRLAEDLPDSSFIIIGPNGKFNNKFPEKPNLKILGPIEYAEIPGYLTNADIGIIPFNQKEYPKLINSISPIKLFEYLACGLPVIATRWNELSAINSPAILCDSYEEFYSGIKKLSIAKIDKQVNSDFAARNDWSFRYRDLLQLLKE